MPQELKTRLINKGIYNIVDAEDIPKQASSEAENFITDIDGVELTRGETRIGNLSTGADSVQNYFFGYKKDGTLQQFRRIGTKVEYLDNADDTWKDAITGLTATNPTSFAPMDSLSGRFVFVFGLDGLWKISISDPADPVDMFDAAINYKGLAIIDKGRATLWGRDDDKTGTYLSHIDEQNWTTVSAEVIETGDSIETNFTGTLANGGAKKTVFAISITDTVETFTDDGNGVLTGDAGGTGTINYATGAYTLTFNAAPTGNVTADYQWEDSNDGGVTDFRFSATRLAGEGDTFRHDKGGDAILRDLVFEGSHFLLKEFRIYVNTLSDDDLTANNNVFREGVGIPSRGAATPTSKGIVFMNTANPENPELQLLGRNIQGDNFDTAQLVPQFDFSPYTFDECEMDTWGDYIVFTGKSAGSTSNDKIFLVNPELKSVDVTNFRADSFAKDSGFLYIGDSVSANTYQVFSGFDDDGVQIEGFWKSNAETYATESLKRLRFIELAGLIALDQQFEVHVSYDDDAFQLIGTVDGRETYVDVLNPTLVGSSTVGSKLVGGDTSVTVYGYRLRLNVKSPKFRKRMWKFVPIGVGYMKIRLIDDLDVLFYSRKLPKKYRKVNA